METCPSRSLPRVTWDENVKSLAHVRRVIYSTMSWLSNPILVIQHNMHKHIIHYARYPYWKSFVLSFITEHSVQTPYSIGLNWDGPKKIGHEVGWLNQWTYAALNFDLPISEYWVAPPFMRIYPTCLLHCNTSHHYNQAKWLPTSAFPRFRSSCWTLFHRTMPCVQRIGSMVHEPLDEP